MRNTHTAFQITIQGALGRDWSSRLEGLDIICVPSVDGQPMTILTGEMVDQTALLGVLNTLYDLHLPILSVERLPAVGTASNVAG